MSLRNHDWRQVIKILNKFGYNFVRQKGSHIILMNESGKMVVVPKHDPIKTGMLAAILDQPKSQKKTF